MGNSLTSFADRGSGQLLLRGVQWVWKRRVSEYAALLRLHGRIQFETLWWKWESKLGESDLLWSATLFSRFAKEVNVEEVNLEMFRRISTFSSCFISPFADARFYWSRDFFPNFVDEDKRTFVSFDGNLYFSYLDNIDEGRYSCTVQSTVSDIGRHGPFFTLHVQPYCMYMKECIGVRVFKVWFSNIECIPFSISLLFLFLWQPTSNNLNLLTTSPKLSPILPFAATMFGLSALLLDSKCTRRRYS